jgi:hypothetical protein
MLIFFPFSDASSQANGCDHEPSDSSSDEGNSSEEGDDGHSYAEFVKKNHVHFTFCVTDDGVIPFLFLGMHPARKIFSNAALNFTG